ncbi:DEAD/DEAH box helicase [Temperatibacter marinus]|uniref:DEAD/DEAH box helicase n=1 Tax=Temperatibacter marinus TaxID=1456591 RepID=A0AA52EAK0_9PROT|nr:DEAD/DEAH box helicase [Temperatibacter marinus]WND01757.1 DEAD/DEAH box helicase [Temperatibacter marinus]
MSEFSVLGLDKRIIKNLDALGIDTPTPIQARGIPLIMNGRDVMGLAQTGTGKTAAFALPIIHRLLEEGGQPAPKTVKALILSPTRELASQIAENLYNYTRYTPLKVLCVVGGQPIHVQKRKLEKGIDILVATPGRLLDLVSRRAIELDQCHNLVLDEADQMLDLGFIEPLKEIAELLNPERQTLLFSATMPKQMAELSKAYLTNPERLQVSAPGKAADKVRQSVHFLNQRGKTTLLKKCFNENPDDISLVFVRTKINVDKIVKHLRECGFKAEGIHGDKRQRERDRAIKKFKAGEVNILVATDVAARGIDIPSVSHVYNYDLPEQSDNYVHRIGRTARAGREGDAVAFCSPNEVPLLRDIERLMKIRIPIASGEEPDESEIEEDSRRRGKGGRGRGRSGASRSGSARGGKVSHNKSGFEARKSKGKRPDLREQEDRKEFFKKPNDRSDDKKSRKSWGERKAAEEGMPSERQSKSRSEREKDGSKFVKGRSSDTRRKGPKDPDARGQYDDRRPSKKRRDNDEERPARRGKSESRSRRDYNDDRPARRDRSDDSRPARRDRSDDRPARRDRSDDRPARRDRSDDRPARRERSDDRPARRERSDDRPARRDRSDDRPARRDQSERRPTNTKGEGRPLKKRVSKGANAKLKRR